ncbi:MAG: nidogen-like domain-containing protein, partial [Actinomycetes bacterium]
MSGALVALGASPAAAEGPNAVRTDAAFRANALPANDDGVTGRVPLGFTADFFGTSYSSVFVNNNGNVTFDAPLATFTPFALTPNGTKIIAPFFGDVDTRGPGSGLTMYGYGTGVVDGHTAFGVNWIDVGYFSQRTDKRNSFQLVLIQREDTGDPENFDIEFNYDKVQWETGEASGGVGGLGGESARYGYSSGSGEALELANSGVDGSLLDGNTTTGLVHNSLNSTQHGRYVLQVRNGVVVPPNSAPVADAGSDVSGGEGSAVALDGSASHDPDGDELTYAWSWTGDVGNDAGADCAIADQAAATTTITCDDDGSYSATLDVSDGTLSHSDSSTVLVGNVAPEIGTPTLTGDAGTACLAGNSVALSFAVTDAGTNDVSDLSGTVDWGDGTTESYTGAAFSGSHLFAPGTYTVQMTAGDADTGTDSRSMDGAVSHLYQTSGLLPPVDSDGS